MIIKEIVIDYEQELIVIYYEQDGVTGIQNNSMSPDFKLKEVKK